MSKVLGRGRGIVREATDAARPRAHDVDSVAEKDRLPQFMGYQDNCALFVHPQVLQHPPQVLAGKGVERPEWFIEQEDRGAVN